MGEEKDVVIAGILRERLNGSWIAVDVDIRSVA